MAYHQEVRLWESRHAVSRKNARSREVFWQWNPEVRVVEGAHVLGLSRVAEAYGTGLDAEVCLSQAASLDEHLDCGGLSVAWGDGGDGRRVRTSGGVGRLEQRVLPLGQDAINNHFGDGSACGARGYDNGSKRRAARNAEEVAKGNRGRERMDVLCARAIDVMMMKGSVDATEGWSNGAMGALWDYPCALAPLSAQPSRLLTLIRFL